jgi:hypothetical protein
MPLGPKHTVEASPGPVASSRWEPRRFAAGMQRRSSVGQHACLGLKLPGKHNIVRHVRRGASRSPILGRTAAATRHGLREACIVARRCHTRYDCSRRCTPARSQAALHARAPGARRPAAAALAAAPGARRARSGAYISAAFCRRGGRLIVAATLVGAGRVAPAARLTASCCRPSLHGRLLRATHGSLHQHHHPNAVHPICIHPKPIKFGAAGFAWIACCFCARCRPRCTSAV